ncbi:MAG: sulfatase [Planctomycetota bacterium]
MRRDFLLAVLACFLVVSSTTHADQRPPNFVVIFLDDAGYGDFGCYGHPTIKTPHIDRMAREGVRFTQHYSAYPVCTLSRYSLLTGRLPARSGMPGVLFPRHEKGIHADEVTIAEMLQDAGYATGCFGKWHLGHTPAYLPLAHGFDVYLGIPYSNDMLQARKNISVPLPLIRGEEAVAFEPDQSLFTKQFTEEAVAFIDQAVAADEPFFVYLPHPMPHVPLFASSEFAGRSLRGLYGDVIEEIDWSVGQIMAALQEAGVAENTLVLLTSDNGQWETRGLNGGHAGMLRAGKGTAFEGGVRVPAIAWWPGRFEGTPRVEMAPQSMLDVYPTLLSLAGVELPEGVTLDGIDLSEHWFDGPTAETTEVLMSRPLYFYDRPDRLVAVRRGPWKLYVVNSNLWGADYTGEIPALFDLHRDPEEKYNRASAQPELVAELSELIAAKQRAVADEGPVGR